MNSLVFNIEITTKCGLTFEQYTFKIESWQKYDIYIYTFHALPSYYNVEYTAHVKNITLNT